MGEMQRARRVIDGEQFQQCEIRRVHAGDHSSCVIVYRRGMQPCPLRTPQSTRVDTSLGLVSARMWCNSNHTRTSERGSIRKTVCLPYFAQGVDDLIEVGEPCMRTTSPNRSSCP